MITSEEKSNQRTTAQRLLESRKNDPKEQRKVAVRVDEKTFILVDPNRKNKAVENYLNKLEKSRNNQL
ncbi:hypothetical protein D0T49_04395 [Paludibacter sp. 221]|uniref:hypothetical protein n=1 Tax=Paludibacter sp. 221 TaxID=2302939 RepID=UPI0013D408B6|nr:hypothetical protein [Paludibacter sp. 221]NDV46278.1 hypothetical protein [Paludibacter sp. 221]